MGGRDKLMRSGGVATGTPVETYTLLPQPGQQRLPLAGNKRLNPSTSNCYSSTARGGEEMSGYSTTTSSTTNCSGTSAYADHYGIHPPAVAAAAPSSRMSLRDNGVGRAPSSSHSSLYMHKRTDLVTRRYGVGTRGADANAGGTPSCNYGTVPMVVDVSIMLFSHDETELSDDSG